MYEQEKYCSVVDYYKIKHVPINGKKKTEKEIMEILFTEIVKKRDELEKSVIIHNNDYIKGYLSEIKSAVKYMYRMMNSGEVDKNYRDLITEYKALCDNKEGSLKLKNDLKSNGQLRAVLDLGLGCSNSLRMMSQKSINNIFVGIDMNNYRLTNDNVKKRSRR
jgi:uncharacterized protein YqeY